VLIDETTVPVNRVALQLGATFSYLYDFGDDWRHEILFEGTLLAEPDAFIPGALQAPGMGRLKMLVARTVMLITSKRSPIRITRSMGEAGLARSV